MTKKNTVISHGIYTRPFLLLLNLVSFFPLKIVMRLPFAKKPRTRAVIICDDCVLLVKNTLGSHRWNFPGGGIHKNEDPKIAIIRELKEELDLWLEPERVRLLATLHALDIAEKSDKILYTATISLEEYYALSLSLELSHLRLYPIKDLTNSNSSLISQIVLQSVPLITMN